MIFELVYTDWRRGIRTKDTEPGYCTVAYTKGMPGSLINCAENFAGYAYPKDEVRNPPCSLSYSVLPVGGQSYAVFCRSAPMVKSSRRVFFTHVVLCPLTELPAGVLPVDIISSPGFFRETWNEEPRLLLPSERPALPTPAPVPAGQPTAWVSLTGDAGWAGRLAQEARAGGARDTVLIVPPGADTLRLIREACAVLPLEQARTVTFNTYYNIAKRSPDIRCAWLFCLAESELGRSQRVNRRGNLFDFAAGAIPPLTETSPYIDAARAGRQLVVEAPRAEPGAERPADVLAAAPKTRVKTRKSLKRRPGIDTVAGGREGAGGSGSEGGHQPGGGRERARNPLLIPLALMIAAVLVAGVVWVVREVGFKAEQPRKLTAQADAAPDEMVDPLLDSQRRDGQQPSATESAAKLPPPVEKPQFVAQDTPTSSPPPAVAVAPAKPAEPVKPTPAKPPPPPVFTRLVAAADGTLTLKLPRPVDLTSDEIFFYAADGRPLCINKQGGSFSGGAASFSCGTGYQEMRLNEGGELRFQGGGGLPFLVDLEPDPEGARHLFVLGLCTNMSATLRLEPAQKGFRLTVGGGQAVSLLERLNKDVAALKWAVVAEGTTNPFPCRVVASERGMFALTAPELYAWHDGRTAKLKAAVEAMAARPLATNTVLGFLSLLPPATLTDDAALPLRKCIKSVLVERKNELLQPASRSANEQTLLKEQKELADLQNTMTNEKLKEGVIKLIELQNKRKGLEDGVATNQKLLAEAKKAAAELQATLDKEAYKEDVKRVLALVKKHKEEKGAEAKKDLQAALDKEENSDEGKKTLALVRELNKKQKKVEECEKALRAASKELAEQKNELDKTENKLFASSIYVKNYVRLQNKETKLNAEILRLSGIVERQGKDAEGLQVIGDELKRLEEWMKAIESGASAYEVIRLLTAEQVKGLTEVTRDRLRGQLVEFFNDPKTGGGAWAAAQAPKEVRVTQVVVAWERKPVFQIQIQEGVTHVPRQKPNF